MVPFLPCDCDGCRIAWASADRWEREADRLRTKARPAVICAVLVALSLGSVIGALGTLWRVAPLLREASAAYGIATDHCRAQVQRVQAGDVFEALEGTR